LAITSKPDYGAALTATLPLPSSVTGKATQKATQEFQVYLDDLESLLNKAISDITALQVVDPQVDLVSYTVVTLPSVTATPGIIFVSDETDGSVPAFSDGVSWRRVTDRAIVS